MFNEELGPASHLRKLLPLAFPKHSSPLLKTTLNVEDTKLRGTLAPPTVDCGFCSALNCKTAVARTLNHGLYSKYTISVDRYNSRIINDLLRKRRRAISIRYQDQKMLNEEQEYLMTYFLPKEASIQLTDIRCFYNQFKDYPRFFKLPFMGIMNVRVRRQRRIEYYRVFGSKASGEFDPPLAHREQPGFSRMLGDSLRREFSDQWASGSQDYSAARQQSSLNAIREYFRELKELAVPYQTLHRFTSEYFHYHTTTFNYHQLYSSRDSSKVMEDLSELVRELDKREKPTQQLSQHHSSLKSKVVTAVESQGRASRSSSSNSGVIANRQQFVSQNEQHEPSLGTRPVSLYRARKTSLDGQSPSGKAFFLPSNYPTALSTAGKMQNPAATANTTNQVHSFKQNISQRRSSLACGQNQTAVKVQIRANEPEQGKGVYHRLPDRVKSPQSANMLVLSGQSGDKPAQAEETASQNKPLFGVEKAPVGRQSLQKSFSRHSKVALVERERHIEFVPRAAIAQGDAVNSEKRRQSVKHSTNSGHKYLLSKRVGSQTSLSHAYNSTAGSVSALTSPNKSIYFSKNSSQEVIDQVYTLTPTKGTESTSTVYKSLEKKQSAGKALLDTEHLLRGPGSGPSFKAKASSRRLLKKVFVKEHPKQLSMVSTDIPLELSQASKRKAGSEQSQRMTNLATPTKIVSHSRVASIPKPEYDCFFVSTNKPRAPSILPFEAYK